MSRGTRLTFALFSTSCHKSGLHVFLMNPDHADPPRPDPTCSLSTDTTGVTIPGDLVEPAKKAGPCSAFRGEMFRPPDGATPALAYVLWGTHPQPGTPFALIVSGPAHPAPTDTLTAVQLSQPQ